MTRTYHTVEQANAMLPTLRGAFATVFQLHIYVKVLFALLDQDSFAPDSDEFELNPRGATPEVTRRLARLRALLDALRDQIDEIQDLGCVIKDLETGTVGWYATDDEYGDVFLSWRMGEPNVSFWHEVNTGHIARRPIAELGTPRAAHRS